MGVKRDFMKERRTTNLESRITNIEPQKLKAETSKFGIGHSKFEIRRWLLKKRGDPADRPCVNICNPDYPIKAGNMASSASIA